MRPASTIEKPPYRVPSMGEIAQLPWNGFRVASTFSGAGGSCLGYRMAGFRVVWANEFVPAAQASYRANAAEDSVLDGRDIREVQARDILDSAGLQPGELDVFDGSPPCQAFSTAGKREKHWGKQKTYEHGAKQCNETLFDEYIRLLRELQPKTFIAENVSGLLKGTAKGYFKLILQSLRQCGYRVECRLLDAQWLGVPQMRKRAIFQGVRNDLGLAPVFPKPRTYYYTVREVCPWLVEQPANSIYKDSEGAMKSADEPSRTICAGGHACGNRVVAELPARGTHDKHKLDDAICAEYGAGDVVDIIQSVERRKFFISELKRICSFPDDFTLIGSYAQQWERLGNSVPPLMMRAIAEAVRDHVLRPLHG